MSIYNFIELGIAYLLAAMMPGPSIALIIRNALINSRLSSIQAALGTILGTALQFGLVLIILVFIENCHCQLKRDHLFAPKRDHLSQKFLAHGNLTFLILSPITWSGNFNHFSMMS